jgi:hypothetical protein
MAAEKMMVAQDTPLTRRVEMVRIGQQMNQLMYLAYQIDLVWWLSPPVFSSVRTGMLPKSLAIAK